jgi:hypothetical protein
MLSLSQTAPCSDVAFSTVATHLYYLFRIRLRLNVQHSHRIGAGLLDLPACPNTMSVIQARKLDPTRVCHTALWAWIPGLFAICLHRPKTVWKICSYSAAAHF